MTLVMFPFSIEGTIKVPPDGAGAALDRLMIALANVRAQTVERQKSSLVFRGGLFRIVSGWNVLVPVGRCKVSERSGHLAFSCSTKELLAVSAAVAVAMGAFIHFAGYETVPIQAEIGVPIAAWMWLFGMNYLTARIRLPRFFARAVSGSLEQQSNQ